MKHFIQKRWLGFALAVGPLCSTMPALASADGADLSMPLNEVLLKTDRTWDGTPYLRYPSGEPEITVLKITIPAHTELPWHTHPMLNTGYLLSGTLSVELASGQRKVLKAGEALAEVVDQVHRGSTGDEPVQLIVFYAGVKGQQTAVPAVSTK